MFLRILLPILLLPIILFAEDGKTPALKPEVVESLTQIANSLNTLEAKKEEEKNPEQIKLIKTDLEDLEYDFIEVATGLNLANSETLGDPNNFSWSNELYVLLSPVINELKEISSRPREIETIKEALAKHEQDFANSAEVITGFKNIQKQTNDPLLEKYLTKFQEKWLEERNKTETEVTILKQRLATRLAEKKSLGAALTEIFDLFFKNRGKNLILTILTCLLFLLILKLTNRLIYKFILHSHNRKKESYLKLLKICYTLLVILGTSFVFVGTLFYLEDWLLLVATGLILLTIAWSTKQIIPRFWMQAVLMMNTGPVREEERVIYQGIPYRVRKINFNSFLINPELDGGILRLPINDLAALRSRHANKEEPWFPTQKGNWILFLESKMHAQVIFQSPENVILQQLGGSKTQLKTIDFLNSKFINLSNGFRINLAFGLDYLHQKDMTGTIPRIFKEALDKKLTDSKLEFSINRISVELAKANSSSLDLAVMIDCDGKGAKDYQKLERTLSRLCVSICNEQGYSIPFDQVRLHLADGANLSGRMLTSE